ncbi:hypothetical protein Droror1_Dr00016210 [Drosera rotundifolia]
MEAQNRNQIKNKNKIYIRSVQKTSGLVSIHLPPRTPIKITNRSNHKDPTSISQRGRTDRNKTQNRDQFRCGSASMFSVVSPANEHGDASPHDVEPCSLFLHQPCTLSRKRAPPVRR